MPPPQVNLVPVTKCYFKGLWKENQDQDLCFHTQYLEAEIWFCLIKFSCSINFWTQKVSTRGLPSQQDGRVGESSNFLLLKKLYYPVEMKNRGTICVAFEREASWCWYSASRAKSFVIDCRSLGEFQSSDCLQHHNGVDVRTKSLESWRELPARLCAG